MSSLENRIINIFGGKSLDHWSVICKLYKSVIYPEIPIEKIKNSGRGNSMYLISFSSKPKHVYSVIDENVIMEADSSLTELISKIKNIWAVRQIAKINVIIYYLLLLLLLLLLLFIIIIYYYYYYYYY